MRPLEPCQPYCSHSAVNDGEWGECRGVSPEVHYHLYNFECFQLQVVATVPDSQLLNLLSVSRLVYILDETMTVVSSANLRSLTEGLVEVQSFV